MKYIIFFGLIGTMLNKTLAEKKYSYLYFSKEFSTKDVKNFKTAESRYIIPGE